jgi:chromate transporter
MSSHSATVTAANSDGPAPGTVKPSEREAFRFWLKLGMISFGGPAGQIAIMHEELVERRRWIGERRFLHALNFCMALPGPEAQQLASYIGYSMYGVRGAITSGGLFVLPSFVLLCGMSAIYVEYGEVAAVAGIVRGLGAAVIALVAAAVIRVGGRVIHTPTAIAMAVVAFGLIVAGVPFPIIIAVAALAGYVTGRANPQLLGKHKGHGDGEDEPEPSQEAGTALRRRFAQALLIWLVPVAALLLAGGLVAQMAGFFTLAALVTFGGAYAVLPYVVQGAVGTFGWLTPSQMIDGLALGETTPGPLIMVVAFVGFVGGWTKQLFGPEHLLLAGATAAAVVTWFTFLPSFVFILAGGPVVESTHGQLKFTAPLTAITAAVVGVILNLAIFFAYHVLWPEGFAARFDVVSALIGIGAAVALFRYRVGVIPVILSSAGAGLVFTLIRGA